MIARKDIQPIKTHAVYPTIASSTLLGVGVSKIVEDQIH